MLHGIDTNHMAIARAAPSGPITSQNRKQPMRIMTRGYLFLGTQGLRSRQVVRWTRLSGDGNTSCSTTRFHCWTIWVRVKWNYGCACVRACGKSDENENENESERRRQTGRAWP